VTRQLDGGEMAWHYLTFDARLQHIEAP